MPIDFTCPHCGARTIVADQYAGQSGPCASCGGTIAIPAAGGVAFGQPRPKGRSSAGPIIAVLAVVAVTLLCIVGALGAVLLPVIGAARKAAQQSTDLNNLQQIGLAVHNYHDSYRCLPPGSMSVQDLPPDKGLSWLTRLLPFLGQEPLYRAINYSEPWDSPSNAQVVNVPLQQFLSTNHPSYTQHLTGGQGKSHYVGIAGMGVDAPTLPKEDPRAGIFGYNRIVRFEDVTDGLSNTIMAAETQENNGPWAAGGLSTIRGLDPARQPYLGAGRQFGRDGGGLVLFADGSVKVLSSSIDPKVLESMSTIHGGEVVLPNF